MIAITKVVALPLPRYDALLGLAIAFQLFMLLTRRETPREFATIAIFHAMGLMMELIKVKNGGWSYPEHCVTKVAGVPLFSGFMYASVGSFVLELTKRLGVTQLPHRGLLIGLFVALYGNFISNLWYPDLKLFLLAVLTVALWRARLGAMPLLPLFPAVGVTVWVAENWATAFGIWRYPRQANGWVPVPPDKLLSWTALAAVSFLLLAVSRGRQPAPDDRPPSR